MKKRSLQAVACCASLVAALAVAGCKTDKPKDANDTEADAGVVVDAGVSDASSEASGAASGVDAGAVADAGTAQVDAGVPSDVQPLSTDGEKPKAGKSTIFDRVLARPKNAGFDVDDIRAQVEKKTGLKVAQARKSARKWVLLQFAPTSKGRDAADQKKLVQVLEATDLFDSVEGDRLMKIKTPQ